MGKLLGPQDKKCCQLPVEVVLGAAFLFLGKSIILEFYYFENTFTLSMITLAI
jgi:hypothetical protein